MLKLSTRGRYAMRAVVDMCARHLQGARTVKLNAIATRQRISVKYLEAIFMALKGANIVKGRRGADGGYHLNGSPDKITALDVVEAVEGPISIVDCCTSGVYCDRRKTCRTLPLWDRLNREIVRALRETTIRDLVGRSRPPR
jgi:Rrf2 family protein